MQSQFTNSHNRKQAGAPIYSGSHVVGVVRGNTFYKTVSSSRHFLRVPPAIGLDASTLKDAEKAGAVWVEVYDKDTRTTYRASIAHIREHGFKVNRGFGNQIALPLDGWTKTSKGAPIQTSLFGAE